MTNSELISITSLAVGSVGAVLGVINTWNALERQKVKLVVRPGQSIFYPSRQLVITVEVLNLSTFPVTISQIGFHLKNGKDAIAPGAMLNGKPLPQRIESRESVTAFFDPTSFDPRQIAIAFASTTCGEQQTGTSPALRQVSDGTSLILNNRN